MLAPEDEDARAGKGDEALLPTVEGIAPTAKARPQPGHEPLPVEGGDVRCPAGGDDEGGVGGDGWRQGAMYHRHRRCNRTASAYRKGDS